ncbi:MAG: hypothetical protein E4H10_14305 [Bacteroidia bacterium]|nr:MAG: hypothetical protein E4H10_14305 [Bacteroidia bacterium]
MSENKFDSMLYGLIPGLLLPPLALVIFWLVKSEMGLWDFLVRFQYQGMLSKALSVATIPNLLLFFVFIWTRRNFSARGVIFATLLMAFVMLVLKFV